MCHFSKHATSVPADGPAYRLDFSSGHVARWVPLAGGDDCSSKDAYAAAVGDGPRSGTCGGARFFGLLALSAEATCFSGVQGCGV